MLGLPPTVNHLVYKIIPLIQMIHSFQRVILLCQCMINITYSMPQPPGDHHLKIINFSKVYLVLSGFHAQNYIYYCCTEALVKQAHSLSISYHMYNLNRSHCAKLLLNLLLTQVRIYVLSRYIMIVKCMSSFRVLLMHGLQMNS